MAEARAPETEQAGLYADAQSPPPRRDTALRREETEQVGTSAALILRDLDAHQSTVPLPVKDTQNNPLCVNVPTTTRCHYAPSDDLRNLKTLELWPPCFYVILMRSNPQLLTTTLSAWSSRCHYAPSDDLHTSKQGTATLCTCSFQCSCGVYAGNWLTCNSNQQHVMSATATRTRSG